MEKNTGLKVSSFQSRFATLCDENPMSDTALADVLHVSKQTISAWKNGTRSPKDLTVRAIAAYFGVNVTWLMGFDVRKNAAEKKKLPKETIENVQFIEEELDNQMSHEAMIISKAINRMPKESRERAFQILKVAFPEFADLFTEKDEE